jgi:hypothetical protein
VFELLSSALNHPTANHPSVDAQAQIIHTALFILKIPRFLQQSCLKRWGWFNPLAQKGPNIFGMSLEEAGFLLIQPAMMLGGSFSTQGLSGST